MQDLNLPGAGLTVPSAELWYTTACLPNHAVVVAAVFVRQARMGHTLGWDMCKSANVVRPRGAGCRRTHFLQLMSVFKHFVQTPWPLWVVLLHEYD